MIIGVSHHVTTKAKLRIRIRNVRLTLVTTYMRDPQYNKKKITLQICQCFLTLRQGNPFETFEDFDQNVLLKSRWQAEKIGMNINIYIIPKQDYYISHNDKPIKYLNLSRVNGLVSAI